MEHFDNFRGKHFLQIIVPVQEQSKDYIAICHQSIWGVFIPPGQTIG